MIDKNLIALLHDTKLTKVILGVWSFDLKSGEYDVFDFEMILKMTFEDSHSEAHDICFSIDSDRWSLIVEDNNEIFKDNPIYYPNDWDELLEISSNNSEFNDFIIFDCNKILTTIGAKVDLIRLYSLVEDKDSVFGIRIDFDNSSFINFFAHWDGGFITTDNFYKDFDVLLNIEDLNPVLIDI
jgi:hypothetical protein